ASRSRANWFCVCTWPVCRCQRLFIPPPTRKTINHDAANAIHVRVVGPWRIGPEDDSSCLRIFSRSALGALKRTALSRNCVLTVSSPDMASWHSWQVSRCSSKSRLVIWSSSPSKYSGRRLWVILQLMFALITATVHDHGLRELLASPCQSGHDRADGYMQCIGNFTVRKFFDLPQYQDFAEFAGQASQVLSEIYAFLRQRCPILDVVRAGLRQ